MSATEVNEVFYLFELKKRKNELKFKRDYLMSRGKDKNDPQITMINQELSGVEKHVCDLEFKLKEKKIILFYPNEEEVEKLNKEIARFKPEEIYIAMETKEGDVYRLLEERGRFLKANNEKRRDIASLVAFVNSLPSKIRDKIIERVKKGKIWDLDASTVDEKCRVRIFKLLNRCGLECTLEGHKIISPNAKGIQWNELRVKLNDAYVWIEPDKKDELIKFNSELVGIGNEIQVMNAEKQIRKFSQEEEKKFEELQKKYVELIRKKEQLLEE